MAESLEVHRFLVVGAFRSGTTFVMHSLRGHSDVAIAPLELTPSPLFTIGLGAFTDFQGGFDLKRDFVRAAFEILCSIRSDRPVVAAGAKTALRDDMDAMDVVTGVEEFLNDYAIILVRRQDLVAQYASLALAQSTGRWHVPEDQSVPVPAPRELDPRPFQRYVREQRAVEACLDRLAKRDLSYEVSYETCIAGQQGIGHVFDALGLSQAHIPPSLGRTTPPLDTWVQNLAELRSIERGAAGPSTEEFDARLKAHRETVLRNENVFFQLERARFLLQEGRFLEAQEEAMRGLHRGTGPVNRHEARAFIVLSRAWTQLGDWAMARAALDELRQRFGSCAEFAEAEAEVELTTGHPDRALARIREARDLDTDFSTVERLDRLEQRVTSLEGRSS